MENLTSGDVAVLTVSLLALQGINKHKFGLIMGSMNGALAEQHRLQQQAGVLRSERLMIDD